MQVVGVPFPDGDGVRRLIRSPPLDKTSILWAHFLGAPQTYSIPYPVEEVRLPM